MRGSLKLVIANWTFLPSMSLCHTQKYKEIQSSKFFDSLKLGASNRTTFAVRLLCKEVDSFDAPDKHDNVARNLQHVHFLQISHYVILDL